MRRPATRSDERALTSSRTLLAVGLALTATLLAACASPAASADPTPARAAASVPAGLRLVAIGDSIPMASPDDCPGCTGFVARYAAAAGKALGAEVTVTNLAQHDNLTLPRLLDELDSFRAALSGADLIVVGIAHNTIELNADEPCGAPLVNDQPDWSAMTPGCATASAQASRRQYDRLFTQIAGWRAGKPTVLRTINRYDDWNGAPGSTLTASQEQTVRLFIDRWNAVLCSSAKAHGFTCADVHRAFNGAAGKQPSADLLAGDYTHPSDRGNAVIADTLAQLGFAPLQQ